MVEPGPFKLYERVWTLDILAELQDRIDFYLRNRWAHAPDLDFADGFKSIVHEAPLYRGLHLPNEGTLAAYVASMSDNDRAELVFEVACLGVSKAVLLRDFPQADERVLEAVGTMYGVRQKGPPPSSRQIFRSVSKAAQANCFIDCYVRRRAYELFDALLFVDAFKHAFAAYITLNDGFKGVLTPSEAWAVIESVLSGRLLLEVCVLSRQPYFRHADPKCIGQSPFLKFRKFSPTAADRSLMYVLDRGGYISA